MPLELRSHSGAATMAVSLRSPGYGMAGGCPTSCERSESIHLSSWRAWVTRFARTSTKIRFRNLAAHCVRGLLSTSRPLVEKAQGRPGACCTRGLACDLRKQIAHEHTGQREHSGLPCAMALRLTSCSSRRTALLPPSPALLIARLTPAPRRPNHTTSPYASGAYVYRAPSVHRISPRVRDDRERPSIG